MWSSKRTKKKNLEKVIPPWIEKNDKNEKVFSSYCLLDNTYQFSILDVQKCRCEWIGIKIKSRNNNKLLIISPKNQDKNKQITTFWGIYLRIVYTKFQLCKSKSVGVTEWILEKNYKLIISPKNHFFKKIKSTIPSY